MGPMGGTDGGRRVARTPSGAGVAPIPVYDAIAGNYDATRGGEPRGDEFARVLARHLLPGDDPVLEVGVGTGVVALGLLRRGRRVLGVDVSSAMLERARGRLGAVVIQGDARRLPIVDASVAQAVSVWVVHAVRPAEALFGEVARVLRPGGRYLVCPTNRSPAADPIDPILFEMFDRAERVHPAWRQNPVSAGDICGWGEAAGFVARLETFESRTWLTTAAEESHRIRGRVWPGLQGLDERAFEAVTAPALAALAGLPGGPIARRAEVDLVVLDRPRH